MQCKTNFYLMYIRKHHIMRLTFYETKLCLFMGNLQYIDLGYCFGQKLKVYCNRDQMS